MITGIFTLLAVSDFLRDLILVATTPLPSSSTRKQVGHAKGERPQGHAQTQVHGLDLMTVDVAGVKLISGLLVRSQ